GRRHLSAIADIQLQRLYKRLEERGYQVTITQQALEILAEAGFDPVYGARPLKRAIQQEIENPLAQKILSGQLLPGKPVTLDVENSHIVAKQ
ncbi:type VI secretion system ATPase TssH, partial [Enterobacter hormaechei]|nr:type VI secretion system ATPase TssH [Enterobacter hormaechei]